MLSVDLASDSEDVHYCKRCKQEFTSLHFYLEHKIQHDNFKVIYARSTYDRRVIVPKLVPKESKVSNQPSTNQNIDGKENQQKLPRRGKKQLMEYKLSLSRCLLANVSVVFEISI